MSLIKIVILLDYWTIRTFLWPAVPRVGDQIIILMNDLRNKDIYPEDDHTVWLKVLELHWRECPDSGDGHPVCVEVVCETVNINELLSEVGLFDEPGLIEDEKEAEREQAVAKDRDDERAALDDNVYGRLADLLEGKVGIAGPRGFKKDSKITRTDLECSPRSQWWMYATSDENLMSEIEAMRKQYDESKRANESAALFADQSGGAA